jgi:putative hydrolase of the HAD superfamily
MSRERLDHADPGPIRVVLFDVGGVLSTDMIETKLADLARRYRLPEEAFLKSGLLLRADADLGRLSDEAYWRAALEQWDVQPVAEDLRIDDYLLPIEGTLEVVRELRARRITVGILSNDTREMAAARRRRHGLEGLFSPIFISSEIGMVKPAPGIYRHALATLGVEGASCLFVDNRDDNVAGARWAGMQALRFDGAGPLRRDLVARGLL